MKSPAGLRARLLFALGAAAGHLAFLLGVRRRVVEENLARAFPGWSAGERRRCARACYLGLGRTLAEVAVARRLDDAALDDWIGIDGLEKVQAALAAGRGVVCALAHTGNWELLARAGARRGLRIAGITRPLRGRFNRWLLGARAEAGLAELREGAVGAAAQEVLRRNQVLGVLIDQNMLPRRGVFVDFFGVPACTTPAAAVYSLRSGAALFAAFPVRQPDGTHRVRLIGPFAPPPGTSRREAARALTQELTRAVEEQVRAFPEQWLWLHRRWKTRPTAAAQGSTPGAPRGTLGGG